MRIIVCFSLFFSLLGAVWGEAGASIFPYQGGEAVVGKIFVTRSGGDRTMSAIAQRHDMGIHELLEANPTLSRTRLLKRSDSVLIPQAFVLPPVREGIVINLAEPRLYYFPKGQAKVMTYPVGIGREGWETPLGVSKVIGKRKNPSWRPTPAIRKHSLKKGIRLPEVVPAGLNNPLGTRAIRLSLPSYLIHGTNMPSGVGRQISSGCLRMYNHDVEELYEALPIETKVTIMNQPTKLAWFKKRLWIETHLPLRHAPEEATLLKRIKAYQQKHAMHVYWDEFEEAQQDKNGIPILIGEEEND